MSSIAQVNDTTESVDSMKGRWYSQRAMSMETGSHLDSEGRRHLVPCRRDDGSISAGRGSKSMRKAIAVFLFASLMFVAASVSWGQSASTEATWESATWETLDAVPAV